MQDFLMIADKITAPAGGWWYVQPETGVRIEGPSWHDLIAAVRKHRLANNIPIGTAFPLDVETAICQRGGLDACREIGAQGVAAHRAIDSDDAVNFLKVLAGAVGSVASGNSPWVAKEEAQRRADICASCKYNVPINCAACGTWAKIAGFLAFMGGRGTTRDDKLLGCGICGCVNRAQVHVELEILRRGVDGATNMRFPDHCWKKA